MIDYKNWDQEHFEFLYGRRIGDYENKMLAVAKKRGDKLMYLFRNSRRWMTLKMVNDDANIIEESRAFLKLGMQAAYGHIKTLENEGEFTELWVGNDKVSVNNESLSLADVATLMEYLDFAYICRCQIVVDAIFEQANNEKTFFSNVNMCSHFTDPTYFLNRSYPNLPKEKLIGLLDEIKEKAAEMYENSEEFSGWYSEHLMPLADLREAFHLGTEATFNTALKIVLDKNRAYFDSEENGRCRGDQEWYPWDVISYVCRAYDKGWKITVEDSRLPMFLVEGKCIVENLGPDNES